MQVPDVISLGLIQLAHVAFGLMSTPPVFIGHPALLWFTEYRHEVPWHHRVLCRLSHRTTSYRSLHYGVSPLTTFFMPHRFTTVLYSLTYGYVRFTVTLQHGS